MSIKVLIADDSAFLRKAITDILEKHESIEILDYAINGKEAVEKVKRYNPDVLVLDLIMPKMNGLEAFEQIMSDLPIPTLILSAINPKTMDSSVQALLMGAFDYIIKPGGLGAKSLPEFRKSLLAKVLLASKSQVKRVYDKNYDLSRKSSFRQEIVSEIFEFGKYLNKLEPIQESDEILDESQVSIKSTEKKLFKTLPEKPISEKRVQSKIRKREKIQILHKKKEKVKPIKEIKPIAKTKIEEIKPIAKAKIKDIPKKKPIVKSELIKTKTYKKSSEKVIKKPLKPVISSLKQQKSIKSPGIKSKQITYVPDLTPVNRVYLRTNVIVIGASTGGPRTLSTILKSIPKNFSCPILIVQHLNENFVETFARTLNSSCYIKIKVAKNNELIQPGVAYISPGEKHMEISVINSKPSIKISSGPPVNFCKPSIDKLFTSAARIYKNRTMGIILTGMGEDGVNGLGAIQKFGGKTIAESEETCVLYGMPKAAAERGYAKYIVPNHKIKDFMIKFA